MAQSVDLDRAEAQILEARKRLAEQKAKLESLIVKGAPTQAAEDVVVQDARDPRTADAWLQVVWLAWV